MAGASRQAVAGQQQRRFRRLSLVTAVIGYNDRTYDLRPRRLTPGEVFGLGLEETGGDIGAALLISHNTLRSLARACGDDLRTGIRALDSGRFDKLFITIRGGPWYHFFGTAYYEAYTATPDDPIPADNRWARTANVLEQWYREYCPTSWQEPDPEKECINRWGIAAADELLTEQPWMGD